MPRLPIDYSKAFIYKLCCKDKSIDECYIGSSTNWIQRKYKHKTDCNNVKQKAYNQKKYVFIRENGGLDNWEMILIHNYPCNTSQELKMQEERVRCEYHNNINSNRAYRTDEELKEYMKEYHKQHYIDNIDKLKEQKKQYRIDNKDKIKQYKKQYNIDNKDKLREYHKQRYIDNKDKNRDKIICECGCEVFKVGLPKHKRTNKHKKLV
jgi:hypothetical protein